MGTWVRKISAERPGPARRLVCLPHAGGAADSSAGGPRVRPEAVEPLAVQYPGRRDRSDEPAAETMADLADAIAAELAELADLPLALFGHSMGAAVAYEVAVRLERDAGIV